MVLLKPNYLAIYLTLFLVNTNQGLKLLKVGKNLCRDLRDCQTYFPCTFFIYDYTHPPSVQQCQSELIFDEELQKCTQPITKEDFQCLLAAKVANSISKHEPPTTTSTRLIRTTTTTTKTMPTVTRSLFTSKPRMNLIKEKEKDKERVEVVAKSTTKSSNLNKLKTLKTSFSVENPINSNLAKENKKEPIEITNKKTSLKKIGAKVSEAKLKVDMDEVEEEAVSVKNIPSKEVDDKYKRICTITNWSQFRSGKAQFQTEYTNIHLCNYILFSSVAISEDSTDSFKLQPIQHNDMDLYARVNLLKNRKSNLKTILRITDDNGRLYSRLSKKKDTRASFIQNTLDYIERHKFDGIDIDWQYPNGASGGPQDKQNFILLLKEFRNAMDSNLILSITISPLTDKIQNSYLLFDLNLIADLVIVEAYDYYGPWDKRTGIIAPVSKMDHQYATEAFMNIDGTVTFLKALGLSPEKIVLGVAAYARSYLLQDPKQTQLNSVTTGNGFSGTYTKINGLLSYYEVCEKKKKGNWKIEWVPHANAPYMYNEDGEWISYENEESLAKKVEYLKENNLAGMLINSIDMDDFHGSFCGEGPYPFLRSSLGLLIGSESNEKKVKAKIMPTTTTTIENKITTLKPKLERKKNEFSTLIASKQMTTKVNLKVETPNNFVLITPPDKLEKNLIISKKLKFESGLVKDLPQQIVVDNGEVQKAQVNIQQQQINQLNEHIKQQELINNLQKSQQIAQNQQHQLQIQQDQWMKQMQQHQLQVENHIKMQQDWENRNQISQWQQQVQQQALAPAPAPAPVPQPIPLPPPTAQPYVPQYVTNSVLTRDDNSKCLNKRSGIYRDEMECSSFYVCETLDTPNNVRYHKFTCPQGLMFSMDECTCDWPTEFRPCVVPLTNNFCKTTGPPPLSVNNKHQQGITYIPNINAIRTETSSSFSCYGKEKGLHRDPYDCTKFYYCQIYASNVNTISNNGDLVVIKHDFTCPAGLHFNMYRCQCDWPTENSCQTANNGLNTLCVSNF